MTSILSRLGGLSLFCFALLIRNASARSWSSSNKVARKMSVKVADPCSTYGLAYVCASRDTARSCNYDPLDCRDYCDVHSNAPMNSPLCNELWSMVNIEGKRMLNTNNRDMMVYDDFVGYKRNKNWQLREVFHKRNRDNLNMVNDGFTNEGKTQADMDWHNGRFESEEVGTYTNLCASEGVMHYCRSREIAEECGIKESDYEVACGDLCKKISNMRIYMGVCMYLKEKYSRN